MQPPKREPTRQIRAYIDDIHFMDRVGNELEKRWGRKPTTAEVIRHIIKKAFPMSYEESQSDDLIAEELDSLVAPAA